MNRSTKRFIKASDCVTRCITGETIIVPVSGGVGDLDSIYTVNEVGTRIWELIDGRTPVSRIIDAIANEYEITAEEAEQDIVDFLGSLEAAGLIRLAAQEGW
ncbi:MAG: PqqD family protein [Candidatus Methylomirabilis oxyfera]|nr:PqqD family protein [Candidatus Methylomirabilis oxyfera]